VISKVRYSPTLSQKVSQPRFKGAESLSAISQMIKFFETSYEPGFILVSKVLGNAIPRVVITRSPEERGDVFFNESTQTAGFFVTLPVASYLLNPVQSWLSKVSVKDIKARNDEAFAKYTGLALNRLKIAKLGKSLGVLAFIAYLKIAMPYIRNYRTIRVTGFSDYKKVIALGGRSKPTEADRRRAEKGKKKDLKIIIGLMISGIINAAAVMALAGYYSRHPEKITAVNGLLNPKRMAMMIKNFALVGKRSNQVMSLEKSGIPTLWFWGVPSYLGWFLGCRDKYEVLEQVSKFGTFVAGYMGTTPLTAHIMKKINHHLMDEVNKAAGKTVEVEPSIYRRVLQYIGFLPKQTSIIKKTYPNYTDVIEKNVLKNPELKLRYLKYLDRKWIYSLTLNLFAVGVLPVVFNIFFSAWRFKREQKVKQAEHKPLPEVTPEPSVTLPPNNSQTYRVHPFQNIRSPFMPTPFFRAVSPPMSYPAFQSSPYYTSYNTNTAFSPNYYAGYGDRFPRGFQN
jgi:hypothetical protein